MLAVAAHDRWRRTIDLGLAPPLAARKLVEHHEADHPCLQISRQIQLAFPPHFLRPGSKPCLLSRTGNSYCNLRRHIPRYNHNLYSRTPRRGYSRLRDNVKRNHLAVHRWHPKLSTKNSVGESPAPSMPLPAHFMIVLTPLAAISLFKNFRGHRMVKSMDTSNSPGLLKKLDGHQQLWT